MRRAACGILYNNDAGVVSRSVEGLARMMTVVVKVFAEFGQTVSEKKTETLVKRAPGKTAKKGTPTPKHRPPPLVAEAVEPRYTQTKEFRYLGRMVHENGDLTREVNRRSRAAYACMKRYARELFDRPGAPRKLNFRLMQAEGMEALLYGLVTWSQRSNHHQQLRTTHH